MFVCVLKYDECVHTYMMIVLSEDNQNDINNIGDSADSFVLIQPRLVITYSINYTVRIFEMLEITDFAAINAP